MDRQQRHFLVSAYVSKGAPPPQACSGKGTAHFTSRAVQASPRDEGRWQAYMGLGCRANPVPLRFDGGGESRVHPANRGLQSNNEIMTPACPGGPRPAGLWTTSTVRRRLLNKSRN